MWKLRRNETRTYWEFGHENTKWPGLRKTAVLNSWVNYEEMIPVPAGILATKIQNDQDYEKRPF